MNDATKDGVSEDNAENDKLIADVRESTQKERMNSVEELAQAARERREAELIEQGQTVETTNTTEETQETDDKPQENEPETQKDTEILEKDDDTDILKVDGKDQKIEKSKIYEAGKRALQKDFAADHRLEEATKILREAKATAESNLKSSASQPSSQDVDDTAQYEQLAQTLKDGDVDEVAKAIGTIMGTGRQEKLATQAVNMQPNDVYGMVEGALQVKDAMDTFKRDPDSGGYGDLWKDEKTRQMVLDKESELAKREEPGTPMERLETAASEVRQWRNDLIESSGGKVVDFKDRNSKKSQAESTPSSAGSTRQEQTEQRPKTEAEKRKETLAKMSRSRGQDLD